MKKLPIGIQSIREILQNGYLYVDKTHFAKKLIEGGKHYFLSRPRRFGKSLFLNTLEEILSGNKELFKECMIYSSDYSWQEHPVIYLDFSGIPNETPEEFDMSLQEELSDIGKMHHLSIEGRSSQLRLKRLIMALSEKGPVVVVVDEYDQPIINHLNAPDIAKKNRNIMKNFFGTLKSLDRYLKLTFVTGITKFSQVSLFSGPNNLRDITMDPHYADIMGYTEREIKHYFSHHIKAISKKRKSHELSSEDSILGEVQRWYNGYRFSKEPLCVYNPFSTLHFMESGDAESYWYSSGTPSFLIDEVKKHPLSVLPLEGISALKNDLSDISSLEEIDLAPLMFQAGYLTIQGYNKEEKSYCLGFPNEEVKEAFFNSLLKEFTKVDPLEVSRMSKEIRNDLINLELDSFFKKMNIHFAKMAYPLFTKAHEGFYQAVFFTFLEKSGLSTHTEVPTNRGRIDLMIKMPRLICIFECKLDTSSKDATHQIETKNYKEKYLDKGHKLLIIGVNFSSQTRNIKEWQGTLFSPDGTMIREITPDTSS